MLGQPSDSGGFPSSTAFLCTALTLFLKKHVWRGQFHLLSAQDATGFEVPSWSQNGLQIPSLPAEWMLKLSCSAMQAARWKRTDQTQLLLVDVDWTPVAQLDFEHYIFDLHSPQVNLTPTKVNVKKYIKYGMARLRNDPTHIEPPPPQSLPCPTSNGVYSPAVSTHSTAP